MQSCLAIIFFSGAFPSFCSKLSSVFSLFLITGKEPQACKEREKVMNDCGDECVCNSKGEATDCVRIRKEFTNMTEEEQKRYVSTAKKIATDPRFKPAYDDLIYTHRILFPSIIHTRDMFLPWHRYFLLQYENLLRQADCRVSAIYWDWSLVADDPFRGEPGDVWYAGDRGLGGNGKCQEGEDGPCCVGDGVFAEGEFSLVPGSVTECLTRKFWKDPVQNSTTVQALLKESDFEKFEATWRQFHNWIHVAIGGTMGTDDSASAPEFFFHHGFVDKFWGDWQSVSDANKNAYFWKVNHLMPRQGIWPWQVIDLMNQPGSMGPIKVKYAPPRGRGGESNATVVHVSPL